MLIVMIHYITTSVYICRAVLSNDAVNEFIGLDSAK